MRRILLIAVAVGILIRPACAWGPQGHEVIATIAEKSLSPAARKQINQLLQGKANSLTEIANWADAVRPARPETAEWHFVDIPVDAQGYDRGRDCKSNDCVVEQINLKVRQLADRSLLPAVRIEALKWVVHLVGDIHQPLHCADNDDRGGNEVKVILGGHTMKLHRVWDSGIIEAAADDHGDYAARLLRSTSASDRRAWQAVRAPAAWANECFAIAKAEIYMPLGLIGHPGSQTTPILLAPDYADSKIGVVETQMKRAGFRLAALLEAVLVRSFW